MINDIDKKDSFKNLQIGDLLLFHKFQLYLSRLKHLNSLVKLVQNILHLNNLLFAFKYSITKNQKK